MVSKVVDIFVVIFIERKIIFTRNYTCLWCPQPLEVMAHGEPRRASGYGFLHRLI